MAFGNTFVADRLGGHILVACYGNLLQRHKLLWTRRLPVEPGVAASEALSSEVKSGDSLVVTARPLDTFLASVTVPREHGPNLALLTRQALMEAVPFLPEDTEGHFWQTRSGEGPTLSGIGMGLPKQKDGICCLSASTLAVEACAQEATSLTLGIEARSDYLALFLVEEGALLAYRAVRRSEDDTSGSLAREMRAFVASHPFGFPETATLFAIEHEPAVEAAASDLGGSLSIRDDWPFLGQWEGWRVQREIPGLERFDLAKIAPPAFLRKVAAGVTVLLLAWWVQQTLRLSYLNEQLDRHEAAHQAALAATMPEIRPGPNMLRQAQDEIERLRRVARPQQEQLPSTLTILALVSETLDAFEQCRLTEVSHSALSVVIKGEIDSLKTLDNLRTALEAREEVATCQIDRADSGPEGVLFQLTAGLQ